jgi:hypothetical protein
LLIDELCHHGKDQPRIPISEIVAKKLVVPGPGSPMGHIWVREKGRDPATRRIVWMFSLTPEGQSHVGTLDIEKRRLNRRLRKAKEKGIFPGDLVRFKSNATIFTHGGTSPSLFSPSSHSIGVMVGWTHWTYSPSNSIIGLPADGDEEARKAWSGINEMISVVLVDNVSVVVPNHVLQKVKRARS